MPLWKIDFRRGILFCNYPSLKRLKYLLLQKISNPKKSGYHEF